MTEIFLHGEVGIDITLKEVKNKLDTSEGDIILRVSSPGGDVFEGYAIYNILKHSGRVKESIIEGLCGSIMTLIVNAAPIVKAGKVSSYMIHNPWSGVQGEAKDMIKTADQLNKIRDVLANVYSEKTNKPLDVIVKLMDNEYYMNSDEALNMGFIDSVVENLKMVAKINKQFIMKDEEKVKAKTLLDEIKALFTKAGSPKNLVLELEDGVKVFVESEDGEVEGKNVFIANEAGEPTSEAAPDGEHRLADGRVITVEGGVVQSVAEAEGDAPDDIEALKAENAELKAKLDEMSNNAKALEDAKAAINEKDEEIKNQTAKLVEVQNKIKNLESIVIGKVDSPKAKETPKAKAVEKPHHLDALAERFKKTRNIL